MSPHSSRKMFAKKTRNYDLALQIFINAKERKAAEFLKCETLRFMSALLKFTRKPSR
jgi:hypothetical protein